MPRQVDVEVKDNLGVDPEAEGFRDTIYLPDTLEEYRELWGMIERERTEGSYQRWRALMRIWSAGDLFFFVLFVLKVGREAWSKYRHEPQFWHPSYLELARVIQFDGSKAVIVASRRLGKSTFATLGDNMQRKLRDPNDATCIFSLTRELAEDHLTPIMTELRENDLLRETWSDRFFWNPLDASGVPFGLKTGVRIKRRSSRAEESFEARAFATRLPTGMGYDRRYYDDIEADTTVQSDVSMEVAEERYISSQDLRSSGGDDINIGTYYHPGGLVRKLHKEYGRKLFLFAGEDLSVKNVPPDKAGPLGGLPSHGFTREQLWDIWKDKGCVKSTLARASYGRQIACDPLAGESSKLNLKLIRRYDEDPREIAPHGTIYVCVDAATGTVKNGEITVAADACFCWVWLLHPSKTFWWIDGWKKRLPPAKRKLEIFRTAQEWNAISHVAAIRIEQYGQAEYVQQQLVFNWERNLFLPVQICNDISSSKRDREYERWDALLAEGVYFPRDMWREDEDGNPIDLVAHMLENELGEFPKPLSDHGLDAGALIKEPVRGEVTPLEWPASRRDAFFKELRGDRPTVASLGVGGAV